MADAIACARHVADVPVQVGVGEGDDHGVGLVEALAKIVVLVVDSGLQNVDPL